MSKIPKTKWAKRVRVTPIPDHLSHIAWVWDSGNMPDSVIRKFLYSSGNFEQGMDRTEMVFMLAFLYGSNWFALIEDLEEWELLRKAKSANYPASFKAMIQFEEDDEEPEQKGITFEDEY